MKSPNEKIHISLDKEMIWLIGLFVIGFVMRLVYMQQNQLNPMYVYSSSFLEPPPDWFSAAALWRSPIFLYFARGVFNIFVHSFFMLRMFFFICGSVNLILIYILTKRIFNVAAAKIAALITLLYIPFIFYEGDLFEPVIAIFFGVILFLMVLKAFENPSKRRWFICGIFWALAFLVRHHFSLFGVAAIIYLIIDFLKNRANKEIIAYIACMLLGLIMVISPITLRNMIVGKDFVVIGYVEGIAFWHGNNPDFDKLRDRAAGFGWEQIQQRPFREMKLSRPPKQSDVSRFFFNEALKFIREHPLEWLKLTAKKTYIFFSGYETMGDSDIYSYREYSPLTALLVGEKGILYPFGVVCPLAIIGMALSARTNRKTALLTIMILTTSFLDIILVVQSRYRIAAAPFFIIAAAYALWWWYENIRKIEKKKGVILSIVFFIILLFLCNLYNPETSPVNKARIFYKKAQGYMTMKNTAAAGEELKKAIAVYPDNPSPMLHMLLGGMYFKDRELDKATLEYMAAIKIEPRNASAHIELARIFEIKSESEKAIVMYKKAIELPMPPYYQMQAHFNLGILYKKKTFYNDAVKELNFVISHQGLPQFSKIVIDAYINLADIYKISGKTKDAISTYEEALKRDPANDLVREKIHTLSKAKQATVVPTGPPPVIIDDKNQ